MLGRLEGVGEAGGGCLSVAQGAGPLPCPESIMADYTHTIDRWDEATGETLFERIAGVGDYQVALERTGPR